MSKILGDSVYFKRERERPQKILDVSGGTISDLGILKTQQRYREEGSAQDLREPGSLDQGRGSGRKDFHRKGRPKGGEQERRPPASHSHSLLFAGAFRSGVGGCRGQDDYQEALFV